MAEMILTMDNFENEVLNSDKPVLVDFWAEWCGPCKMLSPVISEIEEDYEGRIKVGKINVDEQPELAAAFRISNIPTVMVFENGKVKNVSIGYRQKEELTAML